MLYVLLLILLFVFVGIIPFIQMIVSNICVNEEKKYKFPLELFNSDMNNLKYEHIEKMNVHRTSLQNRGSVRLAQGNILSIENLESRKAKAYSVELP